MRTRVALAMVAIPLIAACGGTTAKTQSGGANVKNSPSGPVSGGSITVNKTYWYAGFKVTLGKATVLKAITPTPPAYTQAPERVTIEALFQNLGPDTFNPYNQDLVLQSGSNSYIRHDSTLEKIPDVPGLQSGAGTIAFEVDDKFNLKSANLLVGSANYNQAMVPLGSSGKYVTLEPQKVAVTGTVVIPDAFTLAVSGGDLSYDDAKRHDEQKPGDTNLVLHFSLTSSRDNLYGVNTDKASLRLPDGTATVAAGGNCCTIGPKGTTTPDQFVTFAFKGVDGSYDFIIKGPFGANSADEQADLPITITLGQSAGGGATPSASGAPGATGSTDSPQPTPSGH